MENQTFTISYSETTLLNNIRYILKASHQYTSLNVSESEIENVSNSLVVHTTEKWVNIVGKLRNKLK
jgi:hypothetical protein